jgi:hypothetical protein
MESIVRGHIALCNFEIVNDAKYQIW